MRTSPRSAPADLRVISVLATAALAFANIGLDLHLALVQHVVCPEHGELIHVERNTDPAPAVALPEAGLSSDATPAERIDPLHHGHDGCTILESMRGRATLVSQVVEQVAPPMASASTGPRALPLIDPIARLRVSPKASPPAA